MSDRRDEEMISEVLAKAALDRATAALPLVTIAIVLAVGVSPLLGIPLTTWVLAIDGIAVGVGIVLSIALRRRVVPPRYGHVVAAGAWMLAPITTLAAQLGNGETWLLMTLTIELTAAALQLSFRWAVASTTIVAGLYVPLALRDAGPHAPMFISGVFGAALAGCWIGLFLRRTMSTAESLRLEEQRRAHELHATAAELSRELEERRRAEREREGLREQFVHAQRLESVGTLAAGMAHDMNNILAGVLGVAEGILDVVVDPAVRADCITITQEAQRGADLMRSLLAFSRRGQYQRRPTSVAAIVDEIGPLLAHTLPRSITIAHTPGTSAVVDVDRGQISQALINLSLNAADAMNKVGTLTIETRDVTLDDDNAERLGLPPDRRWARISITDTGCGMDEATSVRIVPSGASS
ncbi:MAG: hypothetical protein NT062_00290 [Proteobacteria bacterium]|nr:hypothetical protein [Pseudomonadota bacterium]